MNFPYKKAFSLIELSIVVLIIGILIAGVTQGSRLVYQSKLKTAQNLTINSAAIAVPNMVLWLEPTLDNAITSATNGQSPENNDLISSWNDTLSPNLTRFSATEATLRPSYVTNGIGGIPTLFFNGAANGNSGKQLFIPYNSAFNTPNFTIFVVTTALAATSNWGTVIMFRNEATFSGYNLYKNNVNNAWEFWNGDSSSWKSPSASLSFNKPVVLTLYRDTTSSKIYKNNSLSATDSSPYAINANTSASFNIGVANASSFYYNGYISEIIYYDRALKTSEMTDINNYLIKKYNII
jgi:prepilin-type N-terminal cleavage/methylation domain-containing protein